MLFEKDSDKNNSVVGLQSQKRKTYFKVELGQMCKEIFYLRDYLDSVTRFFPFLN